MGALVENGRRIKIGARRTGRDPVSKAWDRKQYAPDKHHFAIYGRASVARVEENLRVVREHYGVGVGMAFRLALHLTANAIRANRAVPRVG